jgi:hypothetical protein
VSVYPFVGIGSPISSPASHCCPPLGPKWGCDTLACGGGDGGTQFRRRDRSSGTLCMFTIIPLRVKQWDGGGEGSLSSSQRGGPPCWASHLAFGLIVCKCQILAPTDTKQCTNKYHLGFGYLFVLFLTILLLDIRIFTTNRNISTFILYHENKYHIRTYMYLLYSKAFLS